MKANEKKLLLVAAAVFIAFFLVRLAPMVRNFYLDGESDIAILEDRIQRYRLLFEEEPFLREREEIKREEVSALSDLVFEGSTPSLIASSVQRELRRAVDTADVNIRELSNPRYAIMPGWLEVTQEMSFIIDQGSMLEFINLLNQSRPRLHIEEFSITRNRRQYTGAMTVVGFSKINVEALAQ